jgi:hypothetical protein
MLKKLKELILCSPPIEMDHHFFGKILYMGGGIPKETGYWEAEMVIEGSKEPVAVLINAPKEGPGDKHVNFYKKYVNDLDALFKKCWPIFEPDFQQWTNKTFSGQWRDDFEFMSIEIPREADETNEWTVGYFVEAANHYFTVRFIDGKPRYNEVDG